MVAGCFWLLFYIYVWGFSPLLPILGTIGLILIVLEGSLELELNKSKSFKRVIATSVDSFDFLFNVILTNFCLTERDVGLFDVGDILLFVIIDDELSVDVLMLPNNKVKISSSSTFDDVITNDHFQGSSKFVLHNNHEIA